MIIYYYYAPLFIVGIIVTLFILYLHYNLEK